MPHMNNIALMICLFASAATYAQSSEPAGSSADGVGSMSFSYEILGNPIVGQPIAVNLFVSSDQTDPILLEYRINDASSMIFSESQALEVEVTLETADAPARQQVTVIPQREGRLFLNVSGSLDTDSGTEIRATAIPIQVSAAPPGTEARDAAQNGPMTDGDAVPPPQTGN